jgi:competence protein ComEC
VFLVAAWLSGATVAALAHANVRAGNAALSQWLLIASAIIALSCVLRLMFSAASLNAARVTTFASLAMFFASLLWGHAVWAHDAHCLRLLSEPSAQLLLRLDDVARPRSWLRATARGRTAETQRCAVPATLAVEHGNADPGSWVTITATRLVAGSTLRLDNATIAATGATDWLHGWRGRTGITIDSLFDARAPLVRALLVADQHGINTEVRDRFATAGLVHVLSISGLHVAIIAVAIRTVGSALRLRRSHADLLALFTVGAYVVVLGFPPPLTRAAMMLATVMLADRLGRPVHPWTALALGVSAPTIDPRVVASLGWQLSASGMAALVGGRALMRRWRTRPLHASVRAQRGVVTRYTARVLAAGPQLSGWRLAIITQLLIGVVASAVTAPLVAWVFGRVSLVAPLANVAAAPVVGFLQPVLFLALVLAPFTPVARFVADSAAAPLAALDYIARVASDLPYAALDVAPGRFTALCMGMMTAAFIVSTARRRIWPPLLTGAAALVLALWYPVFARGPGRMELHVIDVGQGDALALRTPKGRWILVDAGRVWQGGDAGRRSVVPYVRRRGGDVALFVLSHPDADHVGGAPSVLEALRPSLWWDPGSIHPSDVYQRSLHVAQRRGIPWQRAQTGDSLHIDGVMIRVLGPDSAWTANQTNVNDASVVLMVQHGQVRVLLTGDAEREQEQWLVDRWGDDLAATVLKVGHHGSRTSSTDVFLDAVKPQVALVSVGAANRYGHPAPEVISALRARQVDILRTDRDGAIVMRSDGRSVQLETRHAQWTHVAH